MEEFCKDSDVLSKYNQLIYLGSKFLKYLTTMTLLDFKEGDGKGEYIRA